MDERDSSTPNEDCWYSTYGNFCKWHQAPFPIFWVGPGDEARMTPWYYWWYMYTSKLPDWSSDALYRHSEKWWIWMTMMVMMWGERKWGRGGEMHSGKKKSWINRLTVHSSVFVTVSLTGPVWRTWQSCLSLWLEPRPQQTEPQESVGPGLSSAAPDLEEWGGRGRAWERGREEERTSGNVEGKRKKEKGRDGRKREERGKDVLWPTIKGNWQWMSEHTSARRHRSDAARCHSSRTLLHWDSADPKERRGPRLVCVSAVNKARAVSLVGGATTNCL